ncbi:hypothetical protein VJ918_07915 [Adlercreutzia sp. R21]|uniref:hypothetical protein n=1 Tax=Adlercreutzia wanghongyangiae TaxID=3111451 RepID=UPI002DB7EC1E|nr:hypothetical protein [Adlercreutzia sp. R21]MEC4184732.1 hypothetical protein [Adlercreutzia sp. R21]
MPELLLEDLRTGAVVRATAPGGILGRAGDFSPGAFSPRVSGVHAVVAASPEGAWTIEHTGRNESSVLRGGSWSTLRAGAPQPLFGGETLKLADMVFRVRINPVGGGFSRPLSLSEAGDLAQSSTSAEGGLKPAPTEAERANPVRNIGVDPAGNIEAIPVGNTGAESVGGGFSRPSGTASSSSNAAASATSNATPVAVAWSVRCPVCGTEHAVEGPATRISTCSFCKDPLDAGQIARVSARPRPVA